MSLKELRHLAELQIPKGVDMEGSADDAELRYLAALSAGEDVKLIGEIGFNAGYSSYNFLASNPLARVISFDIGEHPYVSTAKAYIDKKFPGRHQLIVGDSRETVPQFFKENPDGKFDLIFIDGGHDYEIAKADLVNMKSLAHKGTILVTDDLTPWLPWGIGPTKAWIEALDESLVMQEELVRDGKKVDSIQPPGDRSWVKGKYII